MSPDLKLVNGGGGPQSLPVIETLKMSFAFIGSNIIPIFKVSVIPILFIIAVLELFGFFGAAEEPASLASTVLTTLAIGAAMAIVLAAIGRMVLFGDMPEASGFHPLAGRKF